MSGANEVGFIDRKVLDEGKNTQQKAGWSFQSYFPER
jgi:hypothetical protein